MKIVTIVAISIVVSVGFIIIGIEQWKRLRELRATFNGRLIANTTGTKSLIYNFDKPNYTVQSIPDIKVTYQFYKEHDIDSLYKLSLDLKLYKEREESNILNKSFSELFFPVFAIMIAGAAAMPVLRQSMQGNAETLIINVFCLSAAITLGCVINKYFTTRTLWLINVHLITVEEVIRQRMTNQSENQSSSVLDEV